MFLFPFLLGHPFIHLATQSIQNFLKFGNQVLSRKKKDDWLMTWLDCLDSNSDWFWGKYDPFTLATLLIQILEIWKDIQRTNLLMLESEYKFKGKFRGRSFLNDKGSRILWFHLEYDEMKGDTCQLKVTFLVSYFPDFLLFRFGNWPKGSYFYFLLEMSLCIFLYILNVFLWNIRFILWFRWKLFVSYVCKSFEKKNQNIEEHNI